jgi:hypothetical protein
MDHHKIAVENIVEPGGMDKLPVVDMSSKTDIYQKFRMAKNHLFNDYGLLDASRFFDVIARSNAKYWQSIGEQSPIILQAGLPENVVAQVTLERLYKEPSIVKFVELLQELKNHIKYTSNLPVMRNSNAAEANLHEALIGEVMEAFSKFNLDNLVQLSEGINISSSIAESEEIKHASKNLSNNFNSALIDQYKDTVSQSEKNKLRWSFTKISAKLKFPFIDFGADLEKK